MSSGLLNKGIPKVFSYFKMYTVPNDLAYAILNINCLNLSSTNARIRLAVTTNPTLPPLSDFIDYDLKLDAVGGNLVKSDLVLSPGESFISYSDTDLVAFRLTGVEVSTSAPYFELTNGFGLPIINPIVISNPPQAVNITVLNNLSADKYFQASFSPDFSGLLYIVNAYQDLGNNTTNVNVNLSQTGTYYFRTSNDNVHWSPTLAINTIVQTNYNPVIAPVDLSTYIPGTGYMLNQGGSVTDYNYAIHVENQAISLVNIFIQFPTTIILISNDINFQDTTTTVNNNYNNLDINTYFFNLVPGLTYYIKCINAMTPDHSQPESNVLTITL